MSLHKGQSISHNVSIHPQPTRAQYVHLRGQPPQHLGRRDDYIGQVPYPQPQQGLHQFPPGTLSLSGGHPHDIGKPGPLPPQGGPSHALQYLSGLGPGPHQPQGGMPSPLTADNTGPQLQQSGLHQHHGQIQRQAPLGLFVPHQLQNMSRASMNQINPTPPTAHNPSPQFQPQLNYVRQQSQSLPSDIIQHAFVFMQGCSRSQQYATAPQYSMSPTQQTMYMTPASQPYTYNQQPQQVYYTSGLSNMTAVPRTMSHMVHGGSGTTERREKKILAVVDPATGQDIMPDIINQSSLKENTAPINVIAAQFALQVAALVTAPTENTPPKAEIEESDKTQMPKVLSSVNSSNGLKMLPTVMESKTSLSDINSECDIRVPVHCHTESANVISNGVTTVILEPESVVVLNKLNENCVPETNFSSIVNTSKNSIKVSQDQPNENNRIADEVDKEEVDNVSKVISSCPSLLEKDNMQVSISVEDVLQEEPASIGGPTDIELNESQEEQQVKNEAVVEVKQITDFESQKESFKQNGELTKHGISEIGRVVKEYKKSRGQKRMKELNKKGESKEGGDMDAFLDKEQTPTPLSLSPKPDIVESGSEPSVIPVRPLQDGLSEEQQFVLENNHTNRRVSQELQDVGGAKVNSRNLLEEHVVENQTNLRVLSDQVTENNLVKRRASQEEEIQERNQTNKILPSKDQVVEKNQTSESLLEEEKGIVENTSEVKEMHLQESYIKLKYDYSENQWSPLNQEGKKQYDRAFLLQLQSEPMSLKKPQGLPDLEVIKDKANLSKQVDMRRTVNMNQFRNYHSDNCFMPLYAGIQQRNGQGGGAGRRQSQHSRDKGKKITSSFSKDVKLHESENAWKPSYKAQEPESPQEKKTQELYKKVQGILNKLTPQKFKTLVSQVKELPIDNEERLKGVINLVFKKAIEEPSFSVPYANMCKTLAVMQVPAAEGSSECVKFSKILLTKCQHEFEKDIYDEIKKEERLKAIEEAELEEKKALLLEELEEEEKKAKRRSLGNIRFVGELFKLQMLTTQIMHSCIKKLLGQGDEDSIECLCRLLTTIGRELEKDKNKITEASMEAYFAAMKDIVETRKTSPRIRFMLQDIIDLRQNNWVSRREEYNPKTIDQIHLEAEKEAQQQQLLLQQTHVDRERRKSRSNPPLSEEGWNTVHSRSNKIEKIDTSKLKQFARGGQAEVENIQLGPGRFLYSWGKGSSGGTKSQSQESENKHTLPSNRFLALSSTEQGFDSRRSIQKSAASSRESSQNRGVQVFRKTPSQSLPKEHEKVVAVVKPFMAGGGGTSGPIAPPFLEQDKKEKAGIARVMLQGKEMSEEEMVKRTKPLIDEFLFNSDFKEASQCVMELALPSNVHFFITAAINQVLERSSQARHLVGQLLRDLVYRRIISAEQYSKGLKSILENADDFAIDIPRIWEYLGELIGPMIQDGCIPLSYLKKAVEPCVVSGTAGKLLSTVLHGAARNIGSVKVGEMWKKSGIQWKEFLPSGQNIDKFIEENKLQFTVSETESLPAAQLSMGQIKEHVEFLLQKKRATNKEILCWVEIYVGEERSKTSQFIRALISAIVENAIVGEGNSSELCDPMISQRAEVLQKYLDSNEDLELQALYGLQALVNKLEHPKGLLLDIFNVLYNLDLVSDEAFKKWEQSTDPVEQEGKGVALKSVMAFFTWLKEAEEESEEST